MRPKDEAPKGPKRISSQWQVALPRAMARKVGLKPQDEVYIGIRDGWLTIYPEAEITGKLKRGR